MVAITTQALQAEVRRQQGLSTDIANIQSTISSGKKINQPSDNPQDWVRISQLGQQQAMNDAWNANLTYAQSRSAAATSNLSDINNLMTRVTQLLVSANSASDSSPGREAAAQELDGIRASISDLLNQTDYQGSPVFDDGTNINVPVGAGLNVEAVPTRQSIADNAVGTRSLDDVLNDAINAVRSGTETDISNSLSDAQTALDHVIVAQSAQGVRAQRLDNIGQRLSSSKLDLAEQRSKLEDTDITVAATSLQSKLTTLEAAQAAFVRINSQSLFDLLK